TQGGAPCKSTIVLGGEQPAGGRKGKTSGNGYTNGTNTVTVTVYNPSIDGLLKGVAGYMEVLVTKIQPPFFAKVAGFNNVTMTARAVPTPGAGKVASTLWPLREPAF